MSADKKWNEKKRGGALVNAGFRGVIFVFYLIFKKTIGG